MRASKSVGAVVVLLMGALVGCTGDGVDAGASEGAHEQVASALGRAGTEPGIDAPTVPRRPIGEGPRPIPVFEPSQPPSPVPAIQDTFLRVSSSELYETLVTALQGTKLVLDTTGTSPTILGEPVYGCRYPNQAIRQTLIAECMQGQTSTRAACLADVNAEYPNIKECSAQRPPRHSYIDFGPIAESLGAVDKTFDDIATIHRDSWGPGGIDIDINYVRATINAGSMDAFFTAAPEGRAAANFTIRLQSNSPTLPCAHTSSVLGCPDVELTDMRVLARLTDIGPNPDDPNQLGFKDAVATFTFHRNLTNVPDALLTTFVDVDAIIRNNVERNVARALSGQAGRTALNKAITALVLRKAPSSPVLATVARHFHRAWYEANGTLVVDYGPDDVLVSP